MKGKTKQEKAITLIALVITIVVLLILAAVAINSIVNTNIIAHAENAAKKYNNAVTNEQTMLNEYLNYLNGEISGSGNSDGGGEESIEVILDKDGNDIKGVTVTKNTEAWDKYGNKIVVPAGFKIRVDDTTNNADNVTEGIVIEDCTETATKGNQFVWIPVGTIYTNKEKTQSKTITLGRYSWSGSTGNLVQPTASNPYTSNVAVDSNYTEHQSTSTTKNSKARNINDFYESVMGTASKEGNGGYYIGRYEAGDSSKTTLRERSGSGTLVCKANQVPYNYILQADASSKCQSMYANGYKNDGTGTFSSDLVNSYAWDTAIIFIQTFGTKSNRSTYASTIGLSSIDTEAPQLTGTNRLANVTDNPIDEQLNIYDMAGNCDEWTTETYSDTDFPCVVRGGSFYNSTDSTGNRWCIDTYSCPVNRAFRPVIYVGI